MTTETIFDRRLRLEVEQDQRDAAHLSRFAQSLHVIVERILTEGFSSEVDGSRHIRYNGFAPVYRDVVRLAHDICAGMRAGGFADAKVIIRPIASPIIVVGWETLRAQIQFRDGEWWCEVTVERRWNE